MNGTLGTDDGLLHPIKGCIHDIRNMLTVIEGHAFLMRMDEPPDDTRASIQSIERAAQYAEALCSQLMQFLALENAKYEPVNLSEVIDEIGVLLISSVAKKDSINFELDDHLSKINGIAAQLKRVVINLVLNASQAIGNKRGGVICVSTGLSSGGKRIELIVSDNGCGMDAAILSNIFDASFTTKAKGTGVGLSSAHAIIQKHGGTISVDSDLNCGATFTVLLPVIETDL